MSTSICFLTPSMHAGGMERVLSLLANYAVLNGYSITIVCLIEGQVEYSLNDSVKVITPTQEYKKGFFSKVTTALFLYKTLRALKPEIVLSFSEVFNPLNILVSRIVKVPIYISDRSNPNVVLRKPIRILRKITYPLANGIIAQTEQAKKNAINRNYNKNIIVIPNPLREIDDSYNKEYNKKIISVGRLVDTKKFNELIDIFQSIECAVDWQLIIVGDGYERSNLVKQIKDLKIEHRVTLTGKVKDVDKYFAQSSIFAFTSISEGFPNALSEAVAFPLASISYDCSAGPSDIIRNAENGYLIQINNKISFKKHLEKLISSSELRDNMVKNYMLHREKFNLEKICKEYLNFISK